MEHADIARVQRRRAALLIRIGRQAVRRGRHGRARQRGRSRRIRDPPERERVAVREPRVHQVLHLRRAKSVARLNRKGHRAVGVLHLDEVEERRRSPGVRTGLGNHANLRVLKVAAESEHVGGDVESLIVDAEGWEVGPVIRRSGTVYHGVEDVVAPVAQGVRGRGHGEQEHAPIRILAECDGEQHPAARVLVVERLRVEDRQVFEPRSRTTGSGSAAGARPPPPFGKTATDELTDNSTWLGPVAIVQSGGIQPVAVMPAKFVEPAGAAAGATAAPGAACLARVGARLAFASGSRVSVAFPFATLTVWALSFSLRKCASGIGYRLL